MFKIVQTIEKGQCVLSTVPASWECDGVLRWPKHKLYKLRTNPSSMPEESWSKRNCVVKRKCNSFDAAEKEMRLMSDVSDTDQDNDQIISRNTNNTILSYNDLASKCINESYKEQALTPLRTSSGSNIGQDIEDFLILPEGNYKELVRKPYNPKSSSTRNTTPPPPQPTPPVIRAYDCPSPSPTTPSPTTPVIIHEIQAEVHVETEPAQHLITDSNKNNNIVQDTTQSQLLYTYSNISNNIDTDSQNNHLINLTNVTTAIFEQQAVLAQNQELIMLKLAELSTQLEEHIQRERESQNYVSALNKTLIADKESLDDLEQSLKDANRERELYKTYEVVCGKGKGRGLNNAYALIDEIFDRKFLMSCSWSGGSRTDNVKICFKSYTRVIKLFFGIIVASDKSFTMLECESFFKNILKHSKKRCDAKRAKRSCQKKRANKNTAAKKTNVEVREHTITEPSVNTNEVAEDVSAGRETAI